MKLNTHAQVKAELDKAKQEYEDKVFAIVESVRASKVEPLCQKHGYNFFAGNGLYVFQNKTNEKEHVESIPRELNAGPHLTAIMNMYMEDYGFPADSLGTMMGNC